MVEYPNPIKYRIRVEGIIDSSWSDSLAGLSICLEEQGGSHPVSILSGLLGDQVALQGVLNTLFLLNLPLLGVERFAEEEFADCAEHQPDHKGE